MMRSFVSVCTLLAVLVVPLGVWSQPQANPNIVPTDPLSPQDEQKQFVLPPGFEIQLVAAEPDIQKPLNIAFDDQGRLWVSDTVEYPFPAPKGKKARDTVKVLSNFAASGKAGKVSTFADGLNIPIGVLPLPGNKPREALVYSIPQIYRLSDTTGNGVADKRAPLYGEFGFRDTHGMTNAFLLGFDGWVYACHGFSNQSSVKGRDNKPVVMQSGNTYRMKPDGSHAEQFTWGQVNPFGLAVDPLGYTYSSDCHSQPIYQLIRGGHYPSFGKPHDGLGFAPETITNYRGSTAIAGIVFYAADQFPRKYQGSAFVGDVVTNQIVQFDLRWTGTSPHATQRTLLDCKDKWFRPVDMKIGPDGALYVADFYNRIIGHYEVPLTHPGRDRHRGRIWRIVYTGKDNKGTPSPRQDWTTATAEQLVNDLEHPNLQVRLLATHQLALRGKDTADTVRKRLERVTVATPAGERLHTHGLWVLERQGALKADELTAALKSTSEAVRVHGCRVLAERAKLSREEGDVLRARLSDAGPHVVRAAADALGQHPDPANVRPLLAARNRCNSADSHLVYTVRLALRNQLRSRSGWQAVATGKLDEKDVRALADVALGVPSAEAASFLVTQLGAFSWPVAERTALVHHAARYGSAEDAKKLLALCKKANHGASEQAATARAVVQAGQERGAALTADAAAWVSDITDKLLGSKQEAEVRQGIDLAGLAKLDRQQARLLELVVSPTAGAAVRSAALGVVDAVRNAKTLGKILADATIPVGTRELAATALARANQPATREQLVAALPTAPARLQNSIASALASSKEGGELLLSTISAGKASARLLQEQGLVVRLQSLSPPLANLSERMKKLTAGLPAADAKLAKLLAARRAGYLTAKADAKRGAEVFTKNCAVCHQIGGKGEKIGPQLDGIGLRGLDRLLEDTLDPNRNVDQAFRVTTLTLEKGQVVQGLLLREEGAVLVLADSQGKLLRVNKADVAERGSSPLSPMPANVAEQVPEADYYHLMAYLLAQRPMKP